MNRASVKQPSTSDVIASDSEAISGRRALDRRDCFVAQALLAMTAPTWSMMVRVCFLA